MPIVVLDDDHALAPAFSAVIVIVPPWACWPDRGRTAFLDERLQARGNGSTTEEPLGPDLAA